MKLKFNYRNWQQLIVLTQSPLFQVQHADLSSTYQSDLLLRQRGSDECVPLVTQWTHQQQHPVNYASRSSREKEVRKHTFHMTKTNVSLCQTESTAQTKEEILSSYTIFQAPRSPPWAAQRHSINAVERRQERAASLGETINNPSCSAVLVLN